MRPSTIVITTVLVIGVCAGAVLGGNDKWSASGPFGGAMGQFLILPQNPGVVLASGDTLFRSTNGGATWTPTELPGSLALSAHPRTGEIFAAGYSVFHSTNQGASWQLTSNNSFQGSDAFDIAMDASNPQILYVATRDRIYKSTTGGKTWQAKSSGINLNPGGDCSGNSNVEIDPQNGNNLYALLGCQAYRSTNAGDSWKAVNTGLTFDTYAMGLAIDPTNPQVAYISGGNGIYKTTNGGGNWFSTNCRCGAEMVIVDPQNPQIVYGASQGLMKSVDGGKSWRQIFLPRPTAYLSAIMARGSLVFASAYSGGVYKSANGGAGWKEQDQGINNYRILYLAMNASRPTVFFGGDGSSLYKTANSGQTWTRLINAQELGAGDVKIHPQNPNLIVFSSYSGIAGISVNGGASWSLKQGLNGFTSDIIGLDPMNQNNMFAASHTGGVARSTDRGATWSLVNSGLSDTAVGAMDLRDGQNVFVGTLGGKVFRTSNGGNSWENSSAGLGSAPIVSVVLDKTNPNIAYINTNYQGKGVYKSVDGGKSWVSKNKGMTVGTLLYGNPSKPGTLYAAGFGGVYVTQDGAENWGLFPSNGLGVLQVYLFAINPAQPNNFYAGTNRGLFIYGRTVAPGGPAVDQVSQGAARPGSTVVLSGSNFGASQGSSRITFGTADAGSAISWSDTKITARVPQLAQTGALVVTAGGKQGNPMDFAVPASSGRITPSSGPAGTRVTLTLPNRPTSGLILIEVGYDLATEVTLIPPNVVTCLAPPGSGSVPVYAITNGSRSFLGTFTYR